VPYGRGVMTPRTGVWSDRGSGEGLPWRSSLYRDELRASLRDYETSCAYFLGVSLSSFYARFKAGEFDSQFGMTWVTDYEAAVLAVARRARRRRPRRRVYGRGMVGRCVRRRPEPDPSQTSGNAMQAQSRTSRFDPHESGRRGQPPPTAVNPARRPRTCWGWATG
jgi:hypothetical protein